MGRSLFGGRTSTPTNSGMETVQPNGQISQIKSLMMMAQASKDPVGFINQAAANNPTLRDIITLVNSSGKDPRALFYEMAKQKGVDPEAILSQLR